MPKGLEKDFKSALSEGEAKEGTGEKEEEGKEEEGKEGKEEEGKEEKGKEEEGGDEDKSGEKEEDKGGEKDEEKESVKDTMTLKGKALPFIEPILKELGGTSGPNAVGPSAGFKGGNSNEFVSFFVGE